jgi:tryptophan-rich sensory protein
MMKPEWKAAWAMVVCLLVTFTAGAIGGLAMTASSFEWYRSLAKPSWNPPNWLFGPVWTLLYIAMAVSAWLVWQRRPTCDVRAALVLFGLQLLFNAAWTVLFFAMGSPIAGLVDIALLWCSLLATLVLFWRVTAPAGLLMLPYLVWVTFAAGLNLQIWRLNR